MKGTQILMFMVCLQVSASLLYIQPLFTGGMGANTTFNSTSGQLEGVVYGNITGYNSSLIYRDETFNLNNSPFGMKNMTGSVLNDIFGLISIVGSYLAILGKTLFAIYYTFEAFDSLIPGMAMLGLGLQFIADVIIAWGILQFLAARGGKTIE